jgi:hypothetical protein
MITYPVALVEFGIGAKIKTLYYRQPDRTFFTNSQLSTPEQQSSLSTWMLFIKNHVDRFKRSGRSLDRFRTILIQEII